MKGTKDFNTNKGITLIALVITIIVMLILVGVTISMAVNGGLFDYAGQAAKGTNDAMKAEGQLINDIIDEYIKPNVPETETEEESDALAGTWVFNSGEIVDSLGLSGDIFVNFECDGKKFIKISIYGTAVQFWGANLEFKEATKITDGVLCWNDDISITITDTYDASIHADLLTFLLENADGPN